MATIISINPADYSNNGGLETTTKDDIQNAVTMALKAKNEWGMLSVQERLVYVKKLTQILKENVEQITDLIVSEIGTVRSHCLDEVLWDFDYIDWWINNAEGCLQPETTFEDENSLHQVYHEPIGAIAVITPWNLPFDMFVWGVIPNLIAGNTVIYKAAEECILTGDYLAKLVEKSGLPTGVFSAIHGGSEEGNILVNSEIDGIWFTGSSAVGMNLAQVAGKKLIRTSLELGGSNPAIVFAGYDLDRAIDRIISKRMFNSGQTCDAVKRVLVEKSVYKEFVAKLKSKIEMIKVGPSDNGAAMMGPLVSKKQKELAERQLSESIKMGAEIVAQGQLCSEIDGAYVLPTLLVNINPNMLIWKEEVFAPLLPIMSFNDEYEAIEMANASQYGLGGQVFSGDYDRALRVAKRLQAGAIDVNGGNHWLPENPFGGFKMSGMGREHGKYGLHDLTQIKVISIKK